MSDPETWYRVALRRGHRVRYFHDPDDIVGEYVINEDGSATIEINTAYSPLMQAHGFVHEIGHAELNALASGLNKGGEVPGFLAGEWHRSGYDDDPKDIRHQICCEVERICFRKQE